MAPSVTIFRIDGHKRSAVVCEAMAKGIARISGGQPRIVSEGSYVRPVSDVAIFYGMSGNLPQVLKDHSSQGRRVVTIDLGYWGRTLFGPRQGYHKICVGARHPTAYFRERAHRGRFPALRTPLRVWQPGGRHIIVAGMSAKSAGVEGYGPEDWEKWAVAQIRSATDRPIVYRPKPSWREAKPIAGTQFSVHRDLTHILSGAHLLVTHHSNAAVDALLWGIPVLSLQGVASAMGIDAFADIERPKRPPDRPQWAEDVAWTQFSVAEMADGVPWRHFLDEGLIA